MDKAKVEVRGLRELNSAFRKVDKDLNKQLGREFKIIAEKVAGKVRGRVPRLTGRAAASVKGRGSQRGGSIAFGGNAAPYYPWLDFGGSTGPRKSIKRPFIQEGRYVYPTLEDERDNINNDVDNMLEGIIKGAGFETHGDN